ncbi:MAG: hypothetical protein JW768_15505 [Chitinispirillaceae bacterium]|nr:hypothetical protein [Chitinispirillaceae bacterium]
MKTKAIILILVCCSMAFAREMDGSFGIGGNTTLGGVQGIHLRYFVTHNLAVDGTLGFQFINPGEEDAQNETTLSFDLTGMLLFAQLQSMHFLLGLGFGWQYHSDYERSSDLFAEVPVQYEYFVGDRFSLHVELGLVLDFMQARQYNPLDIDSDIRVALKSDMLAGAGFTFYFD